MNFIWKSKITHNSYFAIPFCKYKPKKGKTLVLFLYFHKNWTFILSWDLLHDDYRLNKPLAISNFLPQYSNTTLFWSPYIGLCVSICTTLIYYKFNESNSSFFNSFMISTTHFHNDLKNVDCMEIFFKVNAHDEIDDMKLFGWFIKIRLANKFVILMLMKNSSFYVICGCGG